MTTPLATIDPESRALAGRCDAIIGGSEAYRCADRPAFSLGAAALREIMDLKKSFEERRTSVTGPLNEALRQINAWFKGPMQKLTFAEQTYKNKMAAFELAENERIRAEKVAAEKNAREEREELERRALRAVEKGDVEKGETLLARAADVVPQAPPTAPIRAAGMSFGEAWEFEITDKTLLPREYLQPDTVKIGQYVRAMKADAKIPGVRIFVRPKVSARGSR